MRRLARLSQDVAAVSRAEEGSRSLHRQVTGPADLVASAAAAEAQEAHRIVQDRHQAGLTTVTELLRSEAALAAARTRRLAAIYDHRVAEAALRHAAGTLVSGADLLN